MNRVRIDIPASLPFSCSIPIRITDINYGNHTGNQVFLELLHEARVRFLSNLGCGELNFFGISLIMSDAAIEFKSEILYGDEVEVQVGVDNHHAVGFDLVYLVSRIRQNQIAVAAKAKTGMICYDYQLAKVMRLPAIAITDLERFKLATPTN